MTFLYMLLALFFWVMLIGLVITSPMWLALLWVLLTGKNWNAGEDAYGASASPAPEKKK